MYTVVMELLTRKRARRFTDSGGVLQSASPRGEKKKARGMWCPWRSTAERKKLAKKKETKSKKIFVLWDGLSLSQSAVVAGQTFPWLPLQVLVTLTVENECEGLEIFRLRLLVQFLTKGSLVLHL